MKFTKATDAKRFTKLALYGAAGTGKSIAALAAPGIKLVIDTEGGMSPYASMTDFQLIDTQSFGTVKEVIDHIASNPPTEETTLIIDSASIIWAGLQQAMLEKKMTEKGMKAMEGTEKVQFSLADWGVLKRWNSDIFNTLMMLKCHVVCTFRESETMDEATFKRTGVFVPQWERNTPYVFDFVGRIHGRKITWTKGRLAQDGKLVDLTGRTIDLPTVKIGSDLPLIWESMFGKPSGKPTEAHPVTPAPSVALEKDPEALRKASFIRSKLSPAVGISSEDLDLYCMNKTMKDGTPFMDAIPGDVHLSSLSVQKLDWLIETLENKSLLVIKRIEELKAKEKK